MTGSMSELQEQAATLTRVIFRTVEAYRWDLAFQERHQRPSQYEGSREQEVHSLGQRLQDVDDCLPGIKFDGWAVSDIAKQAQQPGLDELLDKFDILPDCLIDDTFRLPYIAGIQSRYVFRPYYSDLLVFTYPQLWTEKPRGDGDVVDAMRWQDRLKTSKTQGLWLWIETIATEGQSVSRQKAQEITEMDDAALSRQEEEASNESGIHGLDSCVTIGI